MKMLSLRDRRKASVSLPSQAQIGNVTRPGTHVPGWEDRFLIAFRDSGNVRASCRAAGISRTVAYEKRANDETFRRAWDEAREDAIDVLEATAWQRGMTTSDYLLWKLLESNRRSLYGKPLLEDTAPAGRLVESLTILRVVYDNDGVIETDDDAQPTYESPGATVLEGERVGSPPEEPDQNSVGVHQFPG